MRLCPYSSNATVPLNVCGAAPISPCIRAYIPSILSISAFASASFLYNSFGNGTGDATIGLPNSGSNSITAVPALPQSCSTCVLLTAPRGIKSFTLVLLDA